MSSLSGQPKNRIVMSVNTSFLKLIFTRKMLICVFTGFASGLPLFLLLQLLPVWLRQYGFDVKTIGAFALTQLPYTTKFLWAPFLDRLSPFGLGRRRGWMIIAQLMLITLIFFLGFINPALNLQLVAIVSLAIAIASATFDIAVDAFRREILNDNELGLGNTIHINTYRISSLIPGGLSLILAHYLPWQTVFVVTSMFLLPGLLMSIAVKEPNQHISWSTQKSTKPWLEQFSEMILEPFLDFINRPKIFPALMIILFVFLYKLGDSLATALITIFYMDMGFSTENIGYVAKNANLWPSIFGAFAGGIIMLKIGINKALWLFGAVQLLSIFGFYFLAKFGPFPSIGLSELVFLGAVVSFEYLGVGLGSAAFIAFIARTTNPVFAGTQLALLTSITALPRTVINAFSGFIKEYIGWSDYFLCCAALAIPGMLMLFAVAPWHHNPDSAKNKS